MPIRRIKTNCAKFGHLTPPFLHGRIYDDSLTLSWIASVGYEKVVDIILALPGDPKSWRFFTVGNEEAEVYGNLDSLRQSALEAERGFLLVQDFGVYRNSFIAERLSEKTPDPDKILFFLAPERIQELHGRAFCSVAGPWSITDSWAGFFKATISGSLTKKEELRVVADLSSRLKKYNKI